MDLKKDNDYKRPAFGKGLFFHGPPWSHSQNPDASASANTDPLKLSSPVLSTYSKRSLQQAAILVKQMKRTSFSTLSSPCPSASGSVIRPPSPIPLVLERAGSLGKNKENKAPGSPSPRPPVRTRVLSRTQVRHASAACRLSAESLNNGDLPTAQSEESPCLEVDEGGLQLSDLRSTAQRPVGDCRGEKTVVQKNSLSTFETKPPPYLRDSLDVAGVGLMADSTDMETLMDNKNMLKASYLTPVSVFGALLREENFYHVWVAVTLAMEELKPKKLTSEFERLVMTNFIVELSSAIADCLSPDLPIYTFVDPTYISKPWGTRAMFDQAIAIVEGLEKKGVKRDRIYISVPATEESLVLVERLKVQHSIKTDLVFVSGLYQAAACAAAGAAAITMPMNDILTYHEQKQGVSYQALNPHPGRQNIKATACYMKHHGLATQVIATGIRSLSEIEHCSALDSVCLADFQVETVKWHRMRVNRPPRPGSISVMRASQVPFPPTSLRHKYFSAMSPDTRKETAAILNHGLKTWLTSMKDIHRILRLEIGRHLPNHPNWPPRPLPLPTDPEEISALDRSSWDRLRIVRSTSLTRRGKSILEPVLPTINWKRLAFPQS